MSTKLNFIRTAGLCAIAWMLVGCATQPSMAERKLNGHEGAVVLRIITNLPGGGSLNSIHISRESSDNPSAAGSNGVNVPARAISNDMTVFGAILSPGRYRIDSAAGSGNITLSMKTIYDFPLGRLLSSFEVKEGEASQLGTLIVVPLGDGKSDLGYVPPDAELRDTFELLFPALAEQTRGTPNNAFDMTPEMNRRIRIAAEYKRRPFAVTGHTLMADGSIFMWSKLGKFLLHRAGDRARQWREMDVGSWNEVLSVRAYRGGLLAAGEGGLLRYSSDDGRTWHALTPPSKGMIALAAPMSNGKVIAMVRIRSLWTAYVSDDALLGVWRSLGSFEQERSFTLPSSNTVAVATANRAGVMMNNGAFHVVDAQNGTIERIATGISAVSVSVMADGMLVMRGVDTLAKHLVSDDGGKTWANLEFSRFRTAVTFVNANKVYAVGAVAPGFAGTGAHGLLVSSDRGKTWTQVGVMPNGGAGNIEELSFDQRNGSLLAIMSGGTVMRSTDEGKTWDRDL